jgi:hypothetical protein
MKHSEPFIANLIDHVQRPRQHSNRGGMSSNEDSRRSISGVSGLCFSMARTLYSAIWMKSSPCIQRSHFFPCHILFWVILFGLVQDKDLVRGVKSILLLGDSFTEGQGAEPWFRQIAPQIEKLNYQPINGGLFGTGFRVGSLNSSYPQMKLRWRSLQSYLIVITSVGLSNFTFRRKKNALFCQMGCLHENS